MKRVTGKLNLMNLAAVRKAINGKLGPVECLVIPIEKNNLFVGEKGIYLDLVAFEVKEPKGESKDTHIIKQSLSKEVRESMTEDELKSMPILGNLRIWDGPSESEPVSDMAVQNDSDDLPF